MIINIVTWLFLGTLSPLITASVSGIDLKIKLKSAEFKNISEKPDSIKEIYEFEFNKEAAKKEAISDLNLYINDAIENKDVTLSKHIEDDVDLNNPVFASIFSITDKNIKVKNILILFPDLNAKGYAIVVLEMNNKNKFDLSQVGFTLRTYEEIVDGLREIGSGD